MSDDTQQPALTAAERAEIRYQARQNIRPSFVRNEDIRRLLDALEASEAKCGELGLDAQDAIRHQIKVESERDALAREVAALWDRVADAETAVTNHRRWGNEACAELKDAVREVAALRAAGNDLASALETAVIARQRVEHWSLESAVHAERFLATWRAALAEGRPAEAGEGATPIWVGEGA